MNSRLVSSWGSMGQTFAVNNRRASPYHDGRRAHPLVRSRCFLVLNVQNAQTVHLGLEGAMRVIEVRLSGVFQGLDLYFQIGASGRRHAFLDVGVLEQKFMSGLSEAAWLAAYRDNAVTIDALI